MILASVLTIKPCTPQLEVMGLQLLRRGNKGGGPET